MTKRVWLTSCDGNLNVTKTEPTSIGLNVAVTVRRGEGDIANDGVWLNGERSYDTCVFIDDEATYHSPTESADTETFDLHEAAGGGHVL